MTPETSVQFAGMLPDPDVSVRCDAWAKELGISPAGTAIAADQVVLVEAPLPWPKPIGAHELLAPIMGFSVPTPPPEGGLSTKILAAVPRGFSAGIQVTIFRRSATGAQRMVTQMPDAQALAELMPVLVAGGDVPHVIEEHRLPHQSVLICTQGLHDICCGSEGTRLAQQVEAALPDVEVFRVSHTGGHRFAPTAMTFPDGRMWAHLNVDLVQTVLGGNGDPNMLASLSRGWWGAPMGFAQVAEQAVFALHGSSWNEVERQVSVTTAGDTGEAFGKMVGDKAQCSVESALGIWDMDVQVSRLVPTIACREPGGLPVKSGREFEVANLRKR